MSRWATAATLALALGLWLPFDGLASLSLLYVWLVVAAFVAAVRFPLARLSPSQRWTGALCIALGLAFLLTGLRNPRFVEGFGALFLVVASYIAFRDMIVRFDALAPPLFAILPITIVLHAVQQLTFDRAATVDAIILTGGRFTDPSFGSPNSYGFALAASALAGGWAVERVERSSAKLCIGLAALLCTALLILTFSRGALLALLTGLATLTASRMSVRRLASMLAIAAILGLSFATALSLVPEAAARFSLGGDASGSGRTVIWSILLSRLFDDPASALTGFGIGSISFDLGWILVESAHNTYMDLAYMFGATGLTALVGLLFSTLHGIYRDTDPGRRAMRLSAVSLLGSAAFFDSHFGAVQVGWLVGLLLAVARWPRPLAASNSTSPVS